MDFRMKRYGSLCVRDTKWAMDWEVTEATSAFGLIRSERFILGLVSPGKMARLRAIKWRVTFFDT